MAWQILHMEVEGAVKVSAKGQIVIPKEIRKRLGIEPGKRLIVAVGRNGILLKKAEDVPLEEISERLSKVARKEKVDVDALVNEAIRWARRSG